MKLFEMIKSVWNKLTEKFDSLVKVFHGKLTLLVDKYSGEVISIEGDDNKVLAYRDTVSRILLTTARDTLTKKGFIIGITFLAGLFSLATLYMAITIHPLFLVDLLRSAIVIFSFALVAISHNLPTNLSDFEETELDEGEPTLIVTEETTKELTLVSILMSLTAVLLMIAMS